MSFEQVKTYSEIEKRYLVLGARHGESEDLEESERWI